MAKIYLRKLRAGEMTMDRVPRRWRTEVQVLLDDEEGGVF